MLITAFSDVAKHGRDQSETYFYWHLDTPPGAL